MSVFNPALHGLLGALIGVCVLAGGACTTFNNARPLAPGQHAVAVTLGGPIATVPGVGTIPFPNATLEGRHGLVHHLDVNYGLHLLPLAFGVGGAHVGGTVQFNDQPDPFVPALAVGERLFAFSDVIDPRGGKASFFALSQTDLTASWNVAGEHLLYVGATGYVPLLEPNFFLAPFAGVQLVPGVDWLRLQVEARYLAPYVNTRFAVVDWAAPGDQGAIAVNAGLAFVFGGAQ